MKYIQIDIKWKDLIKNKKFIVISFLLIIFFINYILYNYTTIYHPLKNKLLKQYITYKIDKDAEEIYKMKYSKLTNEYNRKLEELNNEYLKNINKASLDIELAKNSYKKEILNDTYNFAYIKAKDILAHDFEFDIYQLVDKKETPKKIIKSNFVKTIFLANKENQKEINILNLKNNNVKSENKEKQSKIGFLELNLIKSFGKRLTRKKPKIEAVEFNIEPKQIKNGIIVLDNTKINNILPYGINFPSLFSYKANGIKVLRGYLDLHYGVDYKTRPYVYLSLYNFKNKPNKVIISKISPAGNKVVLANINDKGSERYEYLHLSKINVKQGQELKGGEKIGITGKSGYITGPHLHFQVYKNGFYVPYDWGLDVENEIVLKELGFKDNEIKEIIKLGKENTINMEIALALYSSLSKKDKTIKDLKTIVKGMVETEKENKYGYTDYLANKSINNLLIEKEKKDLRSVKKKMLIFIDKLHEIKKHKIMNYLKEHKELLEDTILFDKKLLGNAFNVKDYFKLKDAHGLINYGSCKDYKSKVFDIYTEFHKNKPLELSQYQIDNVNKIIPLILEKIKEKKIVDKLNMKLKDKNISINECDLLFLELGKLKWNSNFEFNNLENGLFYNLSKEYSYNKKKLSSEDIKQQIEDSLIISLNKTLLLIDLLKDNKANITKDFIIKFWLWSFNGINGQSPNNDYYTSNYLFNKKIDNEKENKVGAFTNAIILYTHK